MNKIRIGTYIGTGNGNVRPEIVWRDQTKDEALRYCLKSFYADVNARTERYAKERDEIAARYDDDKSDPTAMDR
tara:strand:- start:722 stop:943 length:222 start_codon:yes stop_codon:yes gene_type:complete